VSSQTSTVQRKQRVNRFSAARVLDRIHAHIFPSDGDVDVLNRDRTRWFARALFVVVVVGYIAQQWIAQPRFVAGGEMWAEMGTNYYPAVQRDPLGSLFASDAGYIPLPQRILALIGWALRLPAPAFPYFFTFTALTLSGVMVGIFCLPMFRRVISSDGVRFVLVVVILAVVDFETRTFINFTYLGACFVSVLACHALVSRGRDMPWLAWLIPLLMISKPAVLIALPFVIIAALFTSWHFRIVSLVAVFVAALQALRLATSVDAGGSLLSIGPSLSLLEKIILTGKYALAYLGKAFMGPTHQENRIGLLMLVGAVSVAVVILGMFFFRSRSWSIVIAGLILILGNSLLIVFTFGAVFGPGLSMVSSGLYDRRTFVLLAGGMMVIAGLISVSTDIVRAALVARGLSSRGAIGISLAAVALLVGMVYASGWDVYASRINRTLTLPVAGVSNWATRSPALSESGKSDVCVALDPFGWVSGPSCVTLSAQTPGGVDAQYPGAVSFLQASKIASGGQVILPAPTEVRTAQLLAVAVLAKSSSDRESTGTFSGEASLGDGTKIHISTTAMVDPEGGVVQLNFPGVGGTDVVKFSLSASSNVLLGVASTNHDALFVTWSGRLR